VIVLTFYRFMRDVVVEAARLRRELAKRYPAASRES
jgi:hypothetical protein